MHTIDELHIERFRGLKGVSLTGLSQVNILVGDNNAGKSSVLEAVALWCSPLDRRSWLDVSRYRGPWPLAQAAPAELTQRLRRIEWLFPHRGNDIESILLRGTGRYSLEKFEARCEVFEGIPGPGDKNNIASESPQMGLDIHVCATLRHVHPDVREDICADAEYEHRFWELEQTWLRAKEDDGSDGPRQARIELVTAFAHRNEQLQLERLTELTKSGTKQPIIDVLRRFDPAIRDIEILADKGRTPVLTIVHEISGHTPVSAFGDGLRRVLYIALLLPSLGGGGGVLLLDELEVSIHTGMLDRIFDWLGAACKDHDVQVFAATHSLEAIDAILGEHGERKHDITAYRVTREGVKRYEGELLSRLRLERGLEVR